MPSDDILDLLGRYASGALSERERQRLFDAALSDQNLFEELAREQELKMFLEQPGARDRMIRALRAPQRKTAWIFSGAVAAACGVLLVAFLLHPRSAPPQLAVSSAPAGASAIPAAEPAPAQEVSPKRAQVRPAAPPVAVDQARSEPAPTDVVQVQAAPQQNVVQPQMAEQRRAPIVAQKTTAFGFHYSLDAKGHLVIVPAADGYLFVKSDEGTVLFGRKQIAAAITTDIAVPDGAHSLTITFSSDATPVEINPVARDESSGQVDGPSPLAVRARTLK